MADPLITFTTVVSIADYDGATIEVPDLPPGHDVSEVWIYSDDEHLHIGEGVTQWAMISGASGLVSNGSSAALVPENGGSIAIAGAAATIFTTVKDVIVQATITAPTGRIGRGA